ncbi:response regulator [bacterium]|nr:response regulator [bacterium]
MIRNIIKRFEQGSDYIPYGITFVIIVGIFDLLTGTEISFSIFYLLPISLVSWFGGIIPGVVFSVLCTVFWFMNEKIGGHFYSHEIMAYWNALMRGMIFLMTAVILSQLKNALGREKKAREAANRASSMKSDFLATMSHEIRTPMNSVIAMTDLLSETPLNEEQKEFLQILRREGNHLLKIINDILDLSKVEAGKFDIENVPFDLRRLIEEVVSVMLVRIHEKGLRLEHTIGTDVPAHVIGDPSCLRRILINLIGNAVKFTAHGEINLRIEKNPDNPAPGSLLFSVSDTGIGIPAEKLDIIFDRFTQADMSITRTYGGTGLGLSISRRMAEAMGGSLWAESTVGQGSTFHASLPFGVPDKAAEPSGYAAGEMREKKKTFEPDTRPLRILLVDDYEINRRIIKAFLGKTPYHIDEVINGEEGVNKVKSGRYDCVLMDMQMPVMDGYAATRAIRAWEHEMSRPETPILALTAHAYREDVQKSIDAGCTAHLSKPIHKNELLESIYAVTADVSPQSESEHPGSGGYRVTVPAELREIVPRFIEEMKDFTGIIGSALGQGDTETIRQTGHKIKGTGGSYGFQVLSDSGASIENAARNGDMDEVRSQLLKLTDYLDHMEVFYE